MKFFNNKIIFVYSLVSILITLPLKNIFVSIATILFVVITLFQKEKIEINFKKEFIIPILLYLLMISSLLWSVNYERSLFGLQKGLPFLAIPLCFFTYSHFPKESLNKIFKWYSFAMLFYALFYLSKALMAFIETNDKTVFFNNGLVPYDPGAIYMSVFSSFALFYYIQIPNKKIFEKIGVTILTVFIFLLSSKSIITIDFIIIVCYYALFAEIPKSTKISTILSVSLFLFFSIFFVKEVKNKFLVEYETAFVDNISKEKSNIQNQNTNKVSIEGAWENKTFNQNDFFPGTALRVYQARVFKELFQEETLFFNGYGLEASQDQIRRKAKEHNLFSEYGEYNFHNQYIQTFSELGVFGFLILVTMLFVNLYNGLYKKDFLHIAFSITMIMLFLSESFFCRQRGIIFFVVLFCLLNSLERKEVKLTNL